jgi:hypothetical protein
MKEDWTKQMKQKLEGHQMTPPAGLWEGISNQMGLEPAPAHKPAIIRRWYWAAAAVVLALVGFFVFYNFDEEQPKLEAKNESPTESRPVNQEPDNQPISTDESAITVEQKTSAQPKLLAMATQQVTVAKTNNIDVIEEQTETSIEEQPAPSAEEKSEPKQELKSEPQQKKQTYLPDVVEPVTTASYSESSSKWTIGLAGSNGLLLAANNYANSTNVQPLYNDASPAHYYTNGMGNIAQAYTYTDVESKHHIPLRLGLSLQYQLNDRLALLSGINYTYLESEFIYPLHKHLDFNQKLSYLGIPIGISWKVWSTEHFNIYLAGGTMLEKCIKADVSEGDLDIHPWQFSINAAAGAEYNFTRQFGVYLEPSLGYYFNDGTKLEHYYKEHPLAPSLQFGLRLHLK